VINQANNLLTVLKTIAASIYTNYETSIVDDEGLERALMSDLE
jgi:hypothetical protein